MNHCYTASRCWLGATWLFQRPSLPEMKLYKSPDLSAERASASASQAGDGPHHFPSRVWINLDALAANVRWIRARIGADVALMAVVKANAYGHGAPAVARTALANGADMLAVANLAEAIEIRAAGIAAPLLVLGALPPDAIAVAMDLDIGISIYDYAVARQILDASRGLPGRLKAHIKVDSGMGRLGVSPQEAKKLCRRLQSERQIELEGIYTHFAKADEDPIYTEEQLTRFERTVAGLASAGFRFKYVHAANSAALLTCRRSLFNVARPGIILYGLNPAPELEAAGLRPVMAWTTQVLQIKMLPPDSPVGYGDSYRTKGVEMIAVLPVGYADGLRRTPYTWREVLVRGRRAPLVGRVNMEKITINVTDIPDVAIGDSVALLGAQGDDEIGAEEIAEWIGSNSYEVLTSIAPRVPRSYIFD